MDNIHAESGTPWIEDKFSSQITGDKIRFSVRLPEKYEREPERRFSVHYFIEDSSAAASELLAPALDRLVSSKQMSPILAVVIRFGDIDWNGRLERSGSEERHIILELIQYVDANYRSIPLRQGRSIHGTARGGREALRCAILFPLMFSAVLAYEPELNDGDLLQGVSAANLRELRLIRMLIHYSAANPTLTNIQRLQGALRFKNFDCQLDENKPLSLQEEIAQTVEIIQRFHERQVMDLEGITLYPNLAYSTINSNPLLLDIYVPASEEHLLPAVVWVHGGGWWRGNKGHNCHGLKLIGHGYIIVSISYRFSTEALFPAQLEDCKAAIRWLKSNAQTYRIDPDRIGVWGSSAGGHLVAMLGVTEDDERFEIGEHLDCSSSVRAVCDFCGPTDLLRMAEPGTSTVDWNAPDTQASLLIGGALQENKEQARLASPVHYVGENKTPPFLIVHSDHDQLVPWEQSRQLYEALESRGAEVTFHTVEARGKGHGIDIDATLPLVVDFFGKHLK